MHPLLKKSLELSSQLNRLAAQNDWHAMEKLVVERQSLLDEYFSISPAPDSNEVITTVAQAIMDTDKQIMLLVTEAKKKAIKESLNLKAAGDAIRQYKNNAQ